MMKIELENVLPREIEKRSFELITEELGERTFPEEQEPISKRWIHTSADFDYADILCFSEGVVEKAKDSIRNGAGIVTDTQMAKSGINKKKLAENFLELVQKLDSDVDKMIKEGVATKADGLSVKVKVNEAEMMLTQVDNGLNLSKMLLCQLCGLPLETDFQLADESMKDLPLPNTYTEANVSTALSNREELKSLELASEIYRQKVNVVRADFLPSVALTANSYVTNPSLVNGFENKFRGMWAAGIVVKIPVFHWGEGIYKVKAAKAEANIARYKLEDIKEKVELQVTQDSYKVNESTKKLALAEKNMEKAEENLRYANLGFKEGVIPTSNVLEAQTAWFSAQAGKIDAQIDVKMSELYLNKSMGILK